MTLRKSVLAELQAIAERHAPHEAVGLLIDERIVIPLRNHSSHPENTFELLKVDIVNALRASDLPETYDLAIWHSHPSGGVGPSRTDLRNRVNGVRHLVVSLVDGELVPTWY